MWAENVKPESMRMPGSLTNVGAGNTVPSRLNAVVVFDRRRPIVRYVLTFVNGYGKLPCFAPIRQHFKVLPEGNFVVIAG